VINTFWFVMIDFFVHIFFSIYCRSVIFVVSVS
jgi:hypothetical protein